MITRLFDRRDLRRMPPNVPLRVGALQRNLSEAGRTAEAWATRREILALHHPGLHRRCYLTDCYAGKLPIPVEDWIATPPNPTAAM